jgi:hypothetical protein
MEKEKRGLTLYRQARYQIQIVGHLDSKRAAWFESLTLTTEYDDDGAPVTTMTVEVVDQSMLHGLLAQIRDMGLPLLAVTHIGTRAEDQESSEESVIDSGKEQASG